MSLVKGYSLHAFSFGLDLGVPDLGHPPSPEEVEGLAVARCDCAFVQNIGNVRPLSRVNGDKGQRGDHEACVENTEPWLYALDHPCEPHAQAYAGLNLLAKLCFPSLSERIQEFE